MSQMGDSCRSPCTSTNEILPQFRSVLPINQPRRQETFRAVLIASVLGCGQRRYASFPKAMWTTSPGCQPVGLRQGRYF